MIKMYRINSIKKWFTLSILTFVSDIRTTEYDVIVVNIIYISLASIAASQNVETVHAIVQFGVGECNVVDDVLSLVAGGHSSGNIESVTSVTIDAVDEHMCSVVDRNAIVLIVDYVVFEGQILGLGNVETVSVMSFFSRGSSTLRKRYIIYKHYFLFEVGLIVSISNRSKF